MPRADGEPTDLLPSVKKAFNAKKLWRKAAFSIKAMNRMATLAHSHPEAALIRENVHKYKEESARVRFLALDRFVLVLMSWYYTGSHGGCVHHVHAAALC